MKTVNIEVHCSIVCMEYCSKQALDINDDLEFADLYYSTYGMDQIKSLYVNGDTENNLIKQKGKYVYDNGFFHLLWNEQSDHPLPITAHVRKFSNCIVDYKIELEDDEEFDIKKIQFVKSTYEADGIPFWIVADYILYDGHKVEADNCLWDIFIGGKYHDTYKIKSLYP